MRQASISTIENLLHQTSLIESKYNEINQATGVDFNIFRILNLEYDEENLHSTFLSSLLNPKGSHGFGTAFLEVLLNQNGIENFNHKTAKVYIEKHIDNVNSENATGGRLDILLEDCNGSAIIIENKILAIDQPQQLLRYYNFACKTYFKKFHLIYLTLEGRSPEKFSTGLYLKESEHYKCWSYKENIRSWLEECKRLATDKPLLRETLSQYLILIKGLTGVSINQDMEKDIVERIIANKENFLSAHTLKDNLDESYRFLLETLRTQMQALAEDLKLTLVFEVKFDAKETGFAFHTIDLGANNLCIKFEFEDKRTYNLAFGFARINKSQPLSSDIQTMLLKRFVEAFGHSETATPDWPCWVYYESLRNWNRDIYARIFDDTLKQEIGLKVKELLRISTF